VVVRTDGPARRSEIRWAGMCPLLAFADGMMGRCVFACGGMRSSSSFSGGGMVDFLGVPTLTLPFDLAVFALRGRWLRWGSTNPFPLRCGGGDDAGGGRGMDRDNARSAFVEFFRA